MSLEIANVKTPLTKYKKTNKPTITLIIIVLTFGEIDNKRSIIDFQKFQTLWLLKKIMSYKERIDSQVFVYIIRKQIILISKVK